MLAKDWNVSETGNSCTFTLKDNIKGHDGTPVTSRRNIHTGIPEGVRDADSLYTTNIERIAYFEALADNTVKVVFDQWFNGALDIMTSAAAQPPVHLSTGPGQRHGGVSVGGHRAHVEGASTL